jgi:hypothetical protein
MQHRSAPFASSGFKETVRRRTQHFLLPTSSNIEPVHTHTVNSVGDSYRPPLLYRLKLLISACFSTYEDFRTPHLHPTTGSIEQKQAAAKNFSHSPCRLCRRLLQVSSAPPLEGPHLGVLFHIGRLPDTRPVWSIGRRRHFHPLLVAALPATFFWWKVI